jgi:hypothetical protein
VKTTNTWEDVESFFKIFRNLNSKDAEDDYEISLEEREAEFWREDFFPNALGYYLDIIPIEGEDDFEDEEEEDDESGDKKKGKKGGSSGKDESKEKCKNQ